ncbi:metalloprotease family protein [Clostridium tepidum]
MKLGFNIKTLTPYAHCKISISANIYIMALLLPSIMVGLLPTIIGLVLGIKMLVFVGSFLIVGGTGDFMIY